MKLFKKFLLILLLSPLFLFSQNTYQIAVLKYNGGGDWYANPTSLPNLVSFCNQNINTNISEEIATVEIGSLDIFNYPFLHMTGHGNVIFSFDEADNLRNYLLAGGFLHIDDNYGMDAFVRPEILKVFPNSQLVEIPPSHSIFHQKYEFKNGLPKIHHHDKNNPQAFGIFVEGKLVILYTYESDLGDGWENQEVHNDSQEIRIEALKMGSNILEFVFNRKD